MTQYSVEEYAEQLRKDEKSSETISKYSRYARAFLAFLGGREVTKEAALAFKSGVTGTHSAAGANGVIAAVNSFLGYLGRGELKVSSLKIQRRVFADERRELRREDLERLLAAAESSGCDRTALIARTIHATGIRVSELPYITLEAARRGTAEITLKGKTREIFIPDKLRKRLLSYAAGRGVTSGAIFVTRTGKPIDRHRIWREMKAVGIQAGILATRVFPHNLRKLFARIFYAKIPNLSALADVLGHSDVNTTRIYTALTSLSLRGRMASLPLLL
jgi:site-specific recombinase XerD